MWRRFELSKLINRPLNHKVFPPSTPFKSRKFSNPEKMSSSTTKPAFVNKIEARIQKRNDKRRKYRLKRQRRGRSGNVAGPSTTRGRKRDRASPPYSILKSVSASFSDEDWKTISSFSKMSDDVFLSAVSEISKERRNEFDIGLVTSDSRSGRIRCDVQSPRNLKFRTEGGSIELASAKRQDAKFRYF